MKKRVCVQVRHSEAKEPRLLDTKTKIVVKCGRRRRHRGECAIYARVRAELSLVWGEEEEEDDDNVVEKVFLEHKCVRCASRVDVSFDNAHAPPATRGR